MRACQTYGIQMDLGKTGVWTTYSRIGEQHAAEAASLVEDLGYGVFWLGGSPRLPSVRPLLEATDKLVVATGIVNLWGYDPTELAAEYATLARDFPERLVVGIGIGHPEATSDYSRPLSAMRAFLDGLDHADPPLPRDRRCLAALAPKMLALSAERSLGAIPYFVPVAHTTLARAQLGAGPLLAPEVAFVHDSDPDRARGKAREYARTYLGLSNYTNNLLRVGFTDEDLVAGGSDRLIDAVIPHGSAVEIAAAVRAHLDAGANHVALQAVGEPGIPRAAWTAVAEAMTA
jgi:probable F420-dependent oxidoreductase